ncbi:MAG: hypothetical protein A2136_00890 [Chloroflexi bacterium RBG_16_54_11]|nr:MAG: hypothetical protein A2136_00890 [Chloroflexi bacterium RBG_16_54_11]
MTNSEIIRPDYQIIANRYTVKQVKCGGMSNIYLCEDSHQNGKMVVLKSLKPQFLPDKAVRAQSLREAAIWVELGWHPNLVQAYCAEFDPLTHKVFLVLEPVEPSPGRSTPTLRSQLTKGEIYSVEKTLKLLLDVARGMKYAARRVPGLVHCDLKPENIFIDRDGIARVGDFGLASAPSDTFDNLPNVPPRSRPSGTPYYMSPEQWRNRKVSTSSDIYSLGCIGLEMLSGDYTIRGRHFKTIAEQHIRGGAIKRLGGLDLPRSLKLFFSRCLKTDASRRFQTWEQVENELIHCHAVLLHHKINPDKNVIDVSLKTQVLKGKTMLTIGEAFLDFGEFQAAIRSFEKARAIGKGQHFLRLVVLSEARIGLAYLLMGQHECAVTHYRKAADHEGRGVHPEYALINEWEKEAASPSV